jgi:hypothetical protein
MFFGGEHMGIRKAFNEALQRIRAVSAVASGRADSRPLWGSPAPETWAGTSLATGPEDPGTGEKIIRAGHVVDEWDGTVALLARRG